MVLDRLTRSAGWVTAGLGVLVAAGIATSRPLGYDLRAYTEAASRLLSHAPLYPLATSDTIFLGPGEYLYPPTTAILFIPLALIPFEVATVLWTAGLVAIALALGWWLVRPLRPDVRPWAAATYVLYLPLTAEVTLGNLNLVTLALCLGVWAAVRRAAGAGAILAVAVGAKLLPLAVPFFLAGARRWRVLAWSAAVAIVVFLVTLPWMGDEWIQYARLLSRIAATPDTSAVSIVPAVLGPVRWLLPLLAFGLAAAAGAMSRRGPERDATFAVALAAAPLAAPGLWYPYLVFALPLLAALARGSARWRIAALVAWATLNVPARPNDMPVAFVGLFFLLAAGALYITRQSPAPDPSPRTSAD